MWVLVDTGILLRLGDPNDPQHLTVDHAVRALRGRGDSSAIAPQNAAELWNVCTRPTSVRQGWGLTTTEAERRLTVIESGFSILAELPSAYSIWRGLIVTHNVKGKQVHDARLVAVIMAHGISHVLTLNSGDFGRFPGIIEIAPADLMPLAPIGGT